MITMYQYLKSLPKNLFEATVMGLMDIEMNSPQSEKFEKIMDSPYTDYFKEVDFSSIDYSGVSELSILGRPASSLPADIQERLKEAIRKYCEVCDYINQQTAEQRSSE